MRKTLLFVVVVGLLLASTGFVFASGNRDVTSCPVPTSTERHSPTKTNVPPTETLVPPTETPIPPTETPVPPTITPVPPTDTPVPPTETSIPPTATGTNRPPVVHDTPTPTAHRYILTIPTPTPTAEACNCCDTKNLERIATSLEQIVAILNRAFPTK